MQNKMVFCQDCRDEVSYTAVEKGMYGTLKGERYDYTGKVAYCDICGKEIYVDWVNDENLELLYEVYRKKHNLIPLTEIRAIPEKYAIGKRPLSLLLGWGELTFTRYCDGDMPTRQYSDILKRIYEDSQFYYSVLEKNKANLKSQAAYSRSRRAVEYLIQNKNDTSKTDMVVEYLLYGCGDITPLSLQKMLYYVQGFYYAFYQSFLIEEHCEAWGRGPVYRDVYSRYKSYPYPMPESSYKPDRSDLSAAEKEVIDRVIDSLGCYSGNVLSQFTKEEAPWLNARAGHEDESSFIGLIPHKAIGQYFMEIKKKYHMTAPVDIKQYAMDRFAALIH